MISRTNAEIGRRCGMLTILEVVETKRRPGNNGRTQYDVMVRCECDCGAHVIRRKRGLYQGEGITCGSKQCRKDMTKTRLWVRNLEDRRGKWSRKK